MHRPMVTTHLDNISYPYGVDWGKGLGEGLVKGLVKGNLVLVRMPNHRLSRDRA